MSTSDHQQQAIQLLRLGIDACSIALQSVTECPHEDPSPASFSVIRTDFMSLLALIYATATKLAISLKTSSPTYSASITPLKDMTKHVAALSHCVNMFNLNEHGKTFTQEAVSLIKDVLISVQSLLQLLLDVEASDDRNKWKEEYLVRTAGVHDIIENARSSSGLSKDNSSAVHKIWSRDLGSLEDGVREVAEMIENAESGGIEDNEEDDGWDELGLGSSKSLDKEELARISKVHTVLRLTILLHKKIASDLLKSPSNNISSKTLDKFASLSPALLSVSDEVVASLFAPQDVSSIQNELGSFILIIQDVKEAVGIFLDEASSESAEEAMKKLSLNGSTEKSSPRKKWFDGCFEQIYKALDSATVTLNANTQS